MRRRTNSRPQPPRRVVRRQGEVASALVGFLILLLFFLGSPSAHARSLTEAERASLGDTVDRFDVAMRSGDFVAVMDVIPPRVLEHIAGAGGVSLEELQNTLVKQAEELLAQVTVHSFGMDLAKAEHRELSDGTPYVLIPTETVMSLDGSSKTAMRSHTLALLDAGVWYLVRISEAQQLEILRQVYPEYVGVEFPRGSMEALSQ